MSRQILFLLFSTAMTTSFAYAQLTLEDKLTQQHVKAYISQNWNDLLRQSTNINDKSKGILYVARDENIDQIKADIIAHLPPDKAKLLDIRYLPVDVSQIKEHGLLYLPYPYIVPGGKFNEMYGWDSYFIELGLLENDRLPLVKNMIENLVYETIHYGAVLNANRTFSLQRSQPPLLTQMILAYFNKTHDLPWLETMLPAINQVYQFWTTPPHLVSDIGLSRYYAGGDGPPPEESPNYYKKVLTFYKKYNSSDYDKNDFYNENENSLNDLFYTADRTVRESGFDITAKYGPFGADIINYVPVDLNVLLYEFEKDTSLIYSLLNNQAMANSWNEKAEARAKLINQYMWNDKLGYYFDYNFKTSTQKLYPYVTTFYPLWAGLATNDQAAAVRKNLSQLLAKGGINTSVNHSGFQWDAPFGWAPMQYFTVMGLAKYGYNNEAREVASRFIRTVNKGFKSSHIIYEKYDVETVSIDTIKKIKFGYATNQQGFGWTNGVYLVLSDFLELKEDKTKNS